MKASTVIYLAALALAATGSPAGAQSQKTLEAFARGPHTGPAEQAIVGVTTRFRDRHNQVIEERHGCGVMLRCDGFVLFSAAMLDHRSDEPDDIRPAIEITVRPGTPEERKVTAGWPKSIPSSLALRIVKLPDTHAPALRTLLPYALKRGDVLTVAWQPWNEAAHRFDPVRMQLVHYASPVKAAPAPAAESFDEGLEGVPSGAVVIGPEGMAVGMVTARSGEDRRRFLSMETLARVTNCVVPLPTPDADFAARDSAVGQGGPGDPAAEKPDPAAQPARIPAGVQAEGGDAGGQRSVMVKVPGGPVVLPRAIVDSQVDMEKATVACVAPFRIDRYQVTNTQFWDYWSRLPNKTSADQAFRRQSWPAGWSDSPTPFGPDLAGLPVLGVSPAGAQGYARSQGKRLPTPYEWALAALGPNGDTKTPEWIAQYIADTNEAAVRIKQAHIGFLKEVPDVHGDDFLLFSTRLHPLTITKVKVRGQFITVNADQRIHGTDFMGGLPWIISPLLGFAPELQAGGGFFDALNGVAGLDVPLRLKMQTFSRTVIERETQPLWDRWKAPLAVLAPGSRSFDVSPFGASDMLWNGSEMVAPPAGANSGPFGFAVSVTMQHPQEKQVLDEQLIVSGPNAAGLAETYSGCVPFSLSRLLDRSPGYPVAQWLWFQNNVEEMRAAMRVLSGWQVNMQPAAATMELRIDNHSPFVGPVFYDNYPLYRDWSKPSKHMRNEIGSAIPLPNEEPLPTPLVPRDSGAFVRFLVPIGFRCAR